MPFMEIIIQEKKNERKWREKPHHKKPDCHKNVHPTYINLQM